MSVKVIIIGGGPSGYSAAMVAKGFGANVTIIERMDKLGGLGLVAGIAHFGASNPILIEARALGGAYLYDIFESLAILKEGNVPGVGAHVMVYNMSKLDSMMQKELTSQSINFLLNSRVVDVVTAGKGNKVQSVKLEDEREISGDVFIDATGAIEGVKACNKYGRGCVGCVYNCPVFGNPGGIVEKRMKVVSCTDEDGIKGVTGTSVQIQISSLSSDLQDYIAKKHFVLIPAPPGIAIDKERMKRAGTPLSLDGSVCRENVILLDTGGWVKVTGRGSPMYAASLRNFPGLEDAFVVQPTAGTRGHLVGWTTMALRDNSLKVDGFENLFCCGVKCGPSNSLMDAVITGDLAGYNAVRWGKQMAPIELPKSLMIGAFIDYLGRQTKSADGLKRRHCVLDREILESLHVYREDEHEITGEVQKLKLTNIYRLLPS